MIIDHIRNYKEFEDLYNSVDNSNLPLIENIVRLGDYVFCFYNEDTGKLEGCIYLEGKDNKVFLSGFSCRKHFKENVEAINTICDYFAEDIYSETPFKHAKLCLKKAGFKHYKDNIYKRKRG